jgi:mono/diheme cytochrome c family protein
MKGPLPRAQVTSVVVVTLAVIMAAAWALLGARSSATSEDAPLATRASEARGRYLVKIGGCNDCHTPGYAQRAGDVPESQWLIGDRIGWRGPWGTTYPANLRRFVQGVSPEQWLEIARRPMRPPMPWFALRDMTDEDLTAIYYYLRALGPAGANAPAYVPPGAAAHTPIIDFVPRTAGEEGSTRRVQP